MAGKGGPNSAKRNRFGKRSVAVLGLGELLRHDRHVLVVVGVFLFLFIKQPLADFEES